MTVFGDYEPEDAWHPHDPRPELIVNLYRRIALLDGLADYPVRLVDPLDELDNRLQAWRFANIDPTPRNLERARQLSEDIQWVRAT
jgi:hypothetical protein